MAGIKIGSYYVEVRVWRSGKRANLWRRIPHRHKPTLKKISPRAGDGRTCRRCGRYYTVRMPDPWLTGGK